MKVESILGFVLQFLISTANQIVLGIMLFCYNKPKRFNKITTIILFVAFFFLNWLSQRIFGGILDKFLIMGWFNLKFFLSPIICLIAVNVILSASFYDCLFYVIVSVVMQHANYHFGFIVLKIFNMELKGLTFLSVYFLISCIVYCVLYFVYVRKFKSAYMIDVGKVNMLVFSVIVVVTALVFNQWADADAKGSLAYSVMGELAVLTLLALMLRTFETSQKEKDKQIIELLLAKESQKQRMTSEAIDAVNRKYHDLKHEITALRFAFKNSETEKYLDEIERQTDTYGEIIKTGNAVLDTILTEKSILCSEYEIKFTCMVPGKDLSFMDPVDMCSVFGNAIDNGIEYLKTVENPDNRIFTVQSKKRGNILCITFENYIYKPVPVENDGLIKTTKGDTSNHGYGLKSIRFIAEKYGGSLTIRQSENRMSLLVMLLF